MIPIWAMLLAAALGGRHAVAPDHLAAVGTYVEKTRGSRRQGLVYALRIAAGHSAGMLATAAVIQGLLMTLPAVWEHAAMWASSLWLMGMGAWIAWDLLQDVGGARDRRQVQTSQEGGGTITPHDRPRRSWGIRVEWLQRPTTAWLVGLLFGLVVAPGDLAIFMLMVKFDSQRLAAFGLLVVFLLTMFAGLALVGSGLGWANSRVQFRRGLQMLSAVAGVGVSLALFIGWMR